MKLDRISLKLSIIILISIMFISSLTGIAIYYQTKQTIVHDIENTLTSKSTLIAQKISSLFQEYGTLVEQMTTNQDMIQFLQSADRRSDITQDLHYEDAMNALNAIAASNQRLSLVWIASEKGNFYIGSGFKHSSPDYSLTTREWYKEARSSKEISYSRPYIDAASGKWVISIIYPIIYGSEPIGYVAADILLESFPQIMGSYQSNSSGYSFLIDADGQIIYHPEPRYTMISKFPASETGLESIIAKMKDQLTGVECIQTSAGEEYISYAPISLTNWSVAVSTPSKGPMSQLKNYSSTIFLYSSIGILVTVVVTYLLLAYYLKRFPFLSNVIQKFVTGEAIINQNDYAIIVVDPNFKITYFSKTAEKMLGYSSEEIIRKENLMLLQDMDDIKKYAAQISERIGKTVQPDLSLFRYMFPDDQTSYDLEANYRHKDGTRIPVSVNVNKMLDHNGKIIGYIRICRDISESKRNQSELLQAKKAAENANKAKSAFLATVSHELRTPLSGIIGLTQLIQKTELTPVQQDYVNKISSSSQTLLQIINEILDFSKVEAGKIDLEETNIHLYQLFHNLSDTVSILQSKKELDVMIDLPHDWPQYVVGDPLRMEQVLLNLISNAIKFTNKGTVTIHAETVRQTSDTLEIRFSITDTGIGISEQQQLYLFEPFMQADSSISRKYGGTGLGLVIAKKLVEVMQGNLEVHSTVGVGSTFFFTIPFRLTPQSSTGSLQPKASLQGHPILVVEDHDEMRSHLERMLRALELDVQCIHSWKKAEQILRHENTRAEILMLDMECYDMYGEETWIRMHSLARQKGLVIVPMTTALGRDAILSLPEQYQPHAILLKPFHIRSLECAIRNLFEHEQPIERIPFTEIETAVTQEKPYRILLAEDHEINQQIAIELLESRGYSVGIASDGYEVLTLLNSFEWDLILMDIHMPDMDGLEATKRIRSRAGYERLPIIAMTANIFQKDQKTYLEAGMNDVIMKPIDVQQMYSTISKWLAPQDADRSLLLTNELQHSSPFQMLKHYGIHVEEAIYRLNNKIHIFTRMLTTFRRDNEHFMERFLDVLDLEDKTTAMRMIHTLKGTAGNLSVQRLFDAATQLEQSMQHGIDIHDPIFLVQLEDLQTELSHVLFALKHFMEHQIVESSTN
ncbi:response regulator [Paenibacillus selenitireducens]|nr:response regulator [Paenibacillus selenitireducens]